MIPLDHKLFATYRDYETEIWYLIHKVKAIYAPYEQTQNANYALFRAMQNPN